MQLIKTIDVALVICFMNSACQQTKNHVLIELDDLNGVWKSSEVYEEDLEKKDSWIELEINEGGVGILKVFDSSGAPEEISFEMLVGAEKIALFATGEMEGMHFVYKFSLSEDELKLENVADEVVMVLRRQK